MKKVQILNSEEVKQKTKRLEGIKPENFTPSGMIRCATDEYESLLHSRDSKRMTKEQFEAYIAPYIEQYKNTPANASQSGGIVHMETLPGRLSRPGLGTMRQTAGELTANYRALHPLRTVCRPSTNLARAER